MIHDLIIGKTKQRRARQPRVIAPVSSVPPVPKDSPENSPQIKPLGCDKVTGNSISDLAMIDDEEQTPPSIGALLREKSISRHSLRESSLTRSIRERSNSRSIREGSPQVTLPPTPITNPEKFGIKIKTEKDSNQKKDYRQGSMLSLISPTESAGSNDMTDNLDGIVSTDTDSAPLSPPEGRSASSLSQQTGKSKGKGGFMAAVAGIFRTASPAGSPVTSPTHSNKQNIRREDSFLGRWARKETPGANKKKDSKSDLITSSPNRELSIKTANLSLQASHPSTPPVPLSRKIKLGSLPPQASEDSFSEEEDENLSLVKEAGSGLPKQILDRLDKRMSKSGKKAARHAGSARARRTQEIQRELEETEVECVTVEAKGVKLEQVLREESDSGDAMSQWYRLLGDKNRLVRREQELMVAIKQLELEEQAEKLEMELGNGAGEVREGEILELLVQKAEQRELLSSMLARDKERYKQEDKDLEIKMAEQGIRLYTPVRNGSKQE